MEQKKVNKYYKFSENDLNSLKLHINNIFDEHEKLEIEILSALNCLERIEENNII